MALIKQGILGGFSGSVANIVGSSWKGKAVMKSKPLSVANPQTAGQVAQRGKFGNTVAFAQLILATIIKPCWDRFASGMSGFNDFIQTNIDLFVGTMPSPIASLVISKGKMALTAIDTAVYTHGDEEVSIAWVDDSGSGFKLSTDEAYIVVVNVTKGELVTLGGGVARNGSPALISATGWDIADAKHAYLAFRRADGTIVSNTGYKIIASQA